MTTSVSFTLPSVDAAGMAADEQGALIVNQATAVIVSAYLDYRARLYAAAVASGSTNHWSGASGVDVPGLVNSVQASLATFP